MSLESKAKTVSYAIEFYVEGYVKIEVDANAPDDAEEKAKKTLKRKLKNYPDISIYCISIERKKENAKHAEYRQE